MKVNVIELAVKGMDIDTLASNIGSLNLELWQADRIVNGIPEVCVPKIVSYLENKNQKYIGYSIYNAMNDRDCLRVEYAYPRTVYFDKEYHMPEGVDCVSREEYSKFYRTANCSSSKSEAYKWPMTYLDTSSVSLNPDDFTVD